MGVISIVTIWLIINSSTNIRWNLNQCEGTAIIGIKLFTMI